MGFRAVALSQVDGAAADGIGRDVAHKLGFGYLNEEVVARVAADHGLSADTVADAERRKSFLARTLELSALGAAGGLVADPSLYVYDHTDGVLSLIRDAVRAAAEAGNVVLVAHASCYACADRPDVLRVWVTASPSARAARWAAERGVAEKEAAKALRRSDAARASYLKRAHGIGAESPQDYDLVINTDRLSPEAAVGIIVAAV